MYVPSQTRSQLEFLILKINLSLWHSTGKLAYFTRLRLMLLQSNLSREVTGLEWPTRKSGRNVFRSLIPAGRLMADEQIKALLTEESPGYITVPRLDKMALLFVYPCRDNKVINLALFHKTKKH